MSLVEKDMAEALHSICTTRAQRELAVYVLLRELIGDCIDKKIAIPGPSKNVFAYIVPARTSRHPRLTPERVAELHDRANSTSVPAKKEPLK